MPKVLFTAETAVIAARKSHEPTSARFKPPEPEPIPQPVITPDVPAEKPADEYQKDRLARVRKQLDKLDEMMLQEDEPQKLDRIASASARLSELERQLSNRPLPGSLKPKQEPAKRPREPLAPMPVVVQPVIQAAPQTPQEPPVIGPENG